MLTEQQKKERRDARRAAMDAERPAVEYVSIVRYHRDRARLLAEMDKLPDGAWVSARHAGAYLGTTPGVLANWRSQRRGPKFTKVGRIVRYQIAVLKAYAEAGLRDTATQ
jgi:hypothetical protein